VERGVDDVWLIKPLFGTERFGKQGRVNGWRTAVPASLCEAPNGPFGELSNGPFQFSNVPDKDTND
jgi:hypothetical protein